MKTRIVPIVNISAWLPAVLAAVLLALTGSVLAAPFVTVGNVSTNEVSVIDMANFSTRVVAPLDGATRIVASEAAGKVFLNTTSGVTILDPASGKIDARIPIAAPITNLVVDASGHRLYALSATAVHVINVTMRTVLATIPLSGTPIALAADDEGSRAYVLTPGRLDMIYVPAGAVIKSVAVDPSASTLALGHDVGKLYVASSGAVGGAIGASAAGTAGIAIIHGATLAVEKFIPTAALAADVHPGLLAVSPRDDKVYIFGGSSTTKVTNYLVLDTALGSVRAVQVPITQSAQFLLTGSNGPVLLGPGGKKLYVGGGSTPGTNVIVEIDTDTDTNSRVLAMPTNGAEYHYLTGLYGSKTAGRFVLAGFIFEHRIHSPGEPHSVGFVDVDSGTTMANVTFAQSIARNAFLFGDILGRGPHKDGEDKEDKQHKQDKGDKGDKGDEKGKRGNDDSQ